MKKITNLLVAFVFALSIVLAVINTAASQKNIGSKTSYASIVPSPPPPPQKSGTGK